MVNLRVGDDGLIDEDDAEYEDLDPWFFQRNPDKAAVSDIKGLSQFVKTISRHDKPSPWGCRWPIDALVVVRPEGYGKSSMVRNLVDYGFRVVFCSKSNAQLTEQEQSFKSRWSDIKIHRYISKGQNLADRLRDLGVLDFKVVYPKSTSPYSSAQVSKTETIAAMAKALKSAGINELDAGAIYEREYEDYKGDRGPVDDDGIATSDVLMMTIAAFQGFASGLLHPWWARFKFSKGLHEATNRLGKDVKRYNLPKRPIAVIIDDPDKTDFDWMRLVEDQDKLDILTAARKKEHKRNKLLFQSQSVEYWLAKGYGELTAKEMAKHSLSQIRVHTIKTFKTLGFEKRPKSQMIGVGLKVNYGPWASSAPKLIVTTTESITAKYAMHTLGNLLEIPLSVQLKRRVTLTKQCHVTLISTTITKKGNHGLLIPIIEKLKQEFPRDQVELIANGLGAELNLLNNRGRNDLADKTLIIKLSIPHPDVARTLWAHFPESKNERELNVQLLADYANQALGRSQGYRWQKRPALLLVDPIYASRLGNSGLLRYHCTPWSDHKPANLRDTFVYHHEEMPIERRLRELLNSASDFGKTQEAVDLVKTLPEERKAAFIQWLKVNTQ